MRHKVKKVKLGRRSAHVRSLLANQVSSLILEGQIKTTVEKAKASRRLADKMVTLAKKGSLANRRRAIAKIRNKNAVSKLFSEAEENFGNRNGGYTRIIRLGVRRGDAAEMCILQWVTEETTSEPKATTEAPVEVVEETPEVEAETTTSEVEEAPVEAEASVKTEEASTEEVVEETTSEVEEAPVETETPAEEEADEDKKDA